MIPENNDHDFLLWIAKRLVFKYKEKKDIIHIVENIISRYNDLSKQNQYFLDQINRTILELNSVIKDTKIDNTKILADYIDSFENLNLDTLFCAEPKKIQESMLDKTIEYGRMNEAPRE